MLWISGIVLVVGLLLAVSIWRFGLWRPLVFQPAGKRQQVSWEDLGPTPLGDKGYTPQGLTLADGHLIFANSWDNTRSRVYRIRPSTMQVVGWFDMPSDALHTSGFAFDGDHLWAVDYISNRCYQIDMEKSLQTQRAEVLGSFSTGLSGTSACCFMTLEGTPYLAISDFMRTAKTYVVKFREALEAGHMLDAVEFAYANEGFSQGLAWDGRYLYESVNKRGVDAINVMDVTELRRTGSARAATVRQLNAPSNGVEDLAIDGSTIYTSDESTFKFYKGQLPDD